MEALISNETGVALDEALWGARAEQAMRLAGVEEGSELSVAFVSDARIAELNLEYRQMEGPTDVLSFEGMAPILGDIVISPDYAARSAAKAGHSTEHELCVLLVHGMLHLLGMDHAEPAEEEAMFRRQALLVEALGC